MLFKTWRVNGDKIWYSLCSHNNGPLSFIHTNSTWHILKRVNPLQVMQIQADQVLNLWECFQSLSWCYSWDTIWIFSEDGLMKLDFKPLIQSLWGEYFFKAATPVLYLFISIFCYLPLVHSSLSLPGIPEPEGER